MDSMTVLTLVDVLGKGMGKMKVHTVQSLV